MRSRRTLLQAHCACVTRSACSRSSSSRFKPPLRRTACSTASGTLRPIGCGGSWPTGEIWLQLRSAWSSVAVRLLSARRARRSSHSSRLPCTLQAHCCPLASCGTPIPHRCTPSPSEDAVRCKKPCLAPRSSRWLPPPDSIMQGCARTARPASAFAGHQQLPLAAAPLLPPLPAGPVAAPLQQRLGPSRWAAPLQPQPQPLSKRPVRARQPMRVAAAPAPAAASAAAKLPLFTATGGVRLGRFLRALAAQAAGRTSIQGGLRAPPLTVRLPTCAAACRRAAG